MASFEVVSFTCRTCTDLNVIAQNIQHKMVACRKCTARQIPKNPAAFDRVDWDSSTRAQSLIDIVSLFGIERRHRLLRRAHCATLARLVQPDSPGIFERALMTGELWVELDTPPDGVRELRTWLEARHSDHALHLLALACVTAVATKGWQFPEEISEALANAYRDVFPNPFVPLEWNPEWFTSTVRGLAAHMYESREFSAMPILGDALQDAGCEHAAVLDHCYQPTPHARGCWLLDALIGNG